MENKLDTLGNRCVDLALALLEKETAPTAATVETVKNLAEIAIEIDRINLQWANHQTERNRFASAVFPARL